MINAPCNILRNLFYFFSHLIVLLIVKMNVSFTFTCPLPAVTSFVTWQLPSHCRALNNNGRKDTDTTHLIVLCICFPRFSHGLNCLWHFVYCTLSVQLKQNYVAFSVKCLEPWPFCTTPTVRLQRHLLEKWTKWLVQRFVLFTVRE